MCLVAARGKPQRLAGLQVKEGAEYPPHGGQLGRGDSTDAAV
jgi:hypothetical protein